ncbi:PAS domain-containing protein, partial [Leptolyngbya cf. ectocarpi LEGE 11479]
MDPQTAELKRLNALLREKLEALEHTEAALRESQERYALAMQASRDGLWDWTILTDEVYYSPQFKAILGYQDDEMENQFSAFASRLHPDDYDRVLAAVHDHIEHRIPYDIEYRLRHKQGTYRWINARGQAIWDETGRAIRMAGSISDITQRKQTEAQIHEMTQRLALATNSAKIGVWDLDLVEDRLIWDDRMYELYGITAETFGGAYEAWKQGVYPDDLPAAHADIQAAIAGEREFHPEFRVLWPDGQVRFIEAHAITLRDETGKAQRMIGVNWDITERKQSEEALRQLNARLETKVQERTQELEKRAHELELSNAELQQFAYVVSHDLQQPLQGIFGFAKILAHIYRNRPDEPVNNYINQIINASQYMSQLIQDLLTYAKVGQTEKVCELTDCNQILKQVLTDLQPSINENHAVVTTNGKLPTLCANETQLMQLFQNLLSNALKYHPPEQPPHVQVSAKHQENEWCFGVHDNGIGIQSKYFDQIFQIFQRLHTKDEYPGTGIGLATCKKIVENHGGRIWV